MEKSKLKVGVDYAYRQRARGSRWENNWRNQVRLIRVLPEVKAKYDGYRWEVDLCHKYGAKMARGVVVGKALYLVQFVGNDGDLTDTVICSGGCLTHTWDAYRQEQAAARERAAKASADRQQRDAVQAARGDVALAMQRQLNADLVSLLALHVGTLTGAYVDYDVALVSIRQDDLAVLVENAVEMAGGRP